jgi:hypothetical protein
MYLISSIILHCLVKVVASTSSFQNASMEAYASRTYFYVGGHYENVVSITMSRIKVAHFKLSNLITVVR